MELVKRKEGQPNILGRKGDCLNIRRLILSKMLLISMERGRNGWLSLLSVPQEWLGHGNQEEPLVTGKRQTSCSSLRRATKAKGAEG